MSLTQTPTILTTEDLFARVDALDPKVAVFDCDGTLWSGDAGSSFMWWSMETGLLSPEKTTWLKARYEGYKRGRVSELAICGEMVQVYAGLDEAALRKAATSFFRDHIEPNIFPELRDLITSLQQRGTDIWAVSSTNDWVIEEGVRRFNIPANRVLAARVAVENGLLTDRLLDVPTDEGKVTALRNAGITAPGRRLRQLRPRRRHARHRRRAFPINPTPALVERSTREGWPIYHPIASEHSAFRQTLAAAGHRAHLRLPPTNRLHWLER